MADQAELHTILDLVRWGASRFSEGGLVFGHGTDNAFDEALVLVSHALHLSAGFPQRYLDARVTAEERRAVLAVLGERIETRKPAAYLTGEAWFAGLPFYVDERVLCRVHRWRNGSSAVLPPGWSLTMSSGYWICVRAAPVLPSPVRCILITPTLTPWTFPPMRWLWRNVTWSATAWKTG